MTDPSNARPAAFFIGDHLALDFLNTVAGDGTEWLTNGADLVDWLQQAGAIDRVAASKFHGDHKRLDAIAERARALRDWLRHFLRKHAGRRGAISKFLGDLAPLNALLAADDSYAKVVARTQDYGRERLSVERISSWSSPEQLLQPIAAAIADLICNEDLALVRSCEGPTCTLMFLDRTKSHARRWCSMAACGNRAKAAAHRARARKSV